MKKMKVYTEEESLVLSLGKKGTPLRDKFDEEMQEYLFDLAIELESTKSDKQQNDSEI
ncbi:MAG: hypothetical protein J1E63_09395 [Muribaculaceae bacterium]|nr:hypothetical protein [Muribaculaceae bacterium]